MCVIEIFPVEMHACMPWPCGRGGRELRWWWWVKTAPTKGKHGFGITLSGGTVSTRPVCPWDTFPPPFPLPSPSPSSLNILFSLDVSRVPHHVVPVVLREEGLVRRVPIVAFRARPVRLAPQRRTMEGVGFLGGQRTFSFGALSSGGFRSALPFTHLGDVARVPRHAVVAPVVLDLVPPGEEGPTGLEQAELGSLLLGALVALLPRKTPHLANVVRAVREGLVRALPGALVRAADGGAASGVVGNARLEPRGRTGLVR